MPESNELLKVPDDYSEIESVMSNYDHQIDGEIAARLRKNKESSGYPGWNFHGLVWFDRQSEMWACEVWVYGDHVDTVLADSLEDIMKSVSDKYGHA